MDRTTWRSQKVSLVRRSGSWPRSNWSGVENSPGFTTLIILKEIQMDLERKNKEPQNFKDQIIFVSVFNDIGWKKNHDNCISNAEKSQELYKEVSTRTLDFSGSRFGKEIVRQLIWWTIGTVQPTKWHSNSKKLVVRFSQPPVLWFAECWNKGKANVPFTSMEISWTLMFYFKQFILWIKSVCTRLLRIGVTNLLWRRKTRTRSNTRGQSNYDCCGSRRIGYVDVFSEASSGKPDDAEWGKIQSIGKEGSHDPIFRKSLIPILCHSRKSLPSSTRWRRWMETNLTCAENILVLGPSHKPNRWRLLQQAQLSDRSLRFLLGKLLTNVEWKLRFHQFANLETWLTLWSRET